MSDELRSLKEDCCCDDIDEGIDYSWLIILVVILCCCGGGDIFTRLFRCVCEEGGNNGSLLIIGALVLICMCKGNHNILGHGGFLNGLLGGCC